MNMNLIPAIDLLDQKCVRLLRGDFDQVTFYDKDPIQLAAHYESLGCKHLHLVDLNGTRDGASKNKRSLVMNKLRQNDIVADTTSYGIFGTCDLMPSMNA